MKHYNLIKGFAILTFGLVGSAQSIARNLDIANKNTNLTCQFETETKDRAVIIAIKGPFKVGDSFEDAEVTVTPRRLADVEPVTKNVKILVTMRHDDNEGTYLSLVADPRVAFHFIPQIYEGFFALKDEESHPDGTIRYKSNVALSNTDTYGLKTKQGSCILEIKEDMILEGDDSTLKSKISKRDYEFLVAGGTSTLLVDIKLTIDEEMQFRSLTTHRARKEFLERVVAAKITKLQESATDILKQSLELVNIIVRSAQG